MHPPFARSHESRRDVRRPSALRFPLLLLLLVVSHRPALTAVVPTGFQDDLVLGGLDQPVGFAFLPDGRLLLVEQRSARVRLLVEGGLAATDPVLTVPNVRTTGGEQGLLGIAIDPAWPSRPYVYLIHDHSLTPTIRLARYRAVGDLDFSGNGELSLDPASRRELIADIPDTALNHNGGTLRFGPDGKLYVSLGDDHDRPCAAQDTVSLRGVILRLDVSTLPDGPGAADKAAIAPADNPFASHSDPDAKLTWVLGLRNPFRFFVDSDGALMIGDVGEVDWEEVDRAPGPGLDFGWPVREGPDPLLFCSGATGPFTEPIATYAHGATGAYAVIGALVYHAPANASAPFPAAYEGSAFFSDYYQGFLRRIVGSGSSWSIAPAVAGQPSPSNWGTGFDAVSDYAVGPDGAIWYLRQFVSFQPLTGQIRRVAPTSTTDVEPGATLAALETPRPTPSRGEVTFAFHLPEPGSVELSLYDPEGRRVASLAKGWHAAGRHEVDWSGRSDLGRSIPAGLYFLRLRTERGDWQRRVVRID